VPSDKKLSVYRKSQFRGPRRSKPRVRDLNRSIRDRVSAEHDLVQRLVRDADVRAAVLRGMKGRIERFAVWNNFDHTTSALTEINPRELPRWRDIGEYLKFHLLCQIALDGGGYSFTVRVRPDLEDKWKREGRDPMDRIKRETGKAMVSQGLRDLEYCYVVETRIRSGKSRSSMHLHGLFLAENPFVATRFKIAMERAIAVHPAGRDAAGISRRSGKEVLVEKIYDVEDDSGRGRGRWATYMAKNATKWDARFTRRQYLSRTATQTAREFWALLREDPLD
jgi:hypothetical protein